MKSYHDISGDGGSRIVEQVVEQQDRVARKLSGVRHRVAVGSGKGGVGKSTMTLELARALRRQGREVAILDADLNGPSQARLAGLKEAPPVPGADGLALPRNSEGIGVVSMGSIVPENESLQFDSVAEGESHTWRATREFTLLTQLLTGVDWGRLDYLLFDLPPGVERTVQYAERLGPETAFVLVSLPSDLTRGVVARSLHALRKRGSRVLGYIENMQGYRCPDCGEVKPLFSAADEVALDLACLGGVPFDPALTDSAESRGAVEAIAAAIESELEKTR